jgi:hypothetical protein
MGAIEGEHRAGSSYSPAGTARNIRRRFRTTRSSCGGAVQGGLPIPIITPAYGFPFGADGYASFLRLEDARVATGLRRG